MTKLFFLIIFLLMGSYSLKADEGVDNDQEFLKALDTVKSPFEDGLPPKPVVIQQPIAPPSQPPPAPPPPPAPMPKAVIAPVVFPQLNLQGVMVGEDMHEAIIDDQIIPLHGTIEGALVESVTKQGVELLYKGKKFFLKVD